MTCTDALQGRSNVARGQEPEATALMSRAKDEQERLPASSARTSCDQPRVKRKKAHLLGKRQAGAGGDFLGCHGDLFFLEKVFSSGPHGIFS